MIAINKGDKIPAVLLKKGVEETAKNIQLFENEEDYRNGIKKFDIKSAIYGHKTVKNLLRTLQHSKCCFCEKKTEIGDVEHFRPKAFYQQDEMNVPSKTGYYWLAYDWENLFFSCEVCNRSFKKNYFPLEDETQRAKNHLESIENEVPLFINPAKENPSDFIEYVGTAITPKNAKGKISLQRIGIDRDFLLNEEKLAWYRKHKLLYQTVQMLHEIINTNGLNSTERNKIQKLVQEANKELDHAISPTSPYSLMIICAIKDNFRY